MATAVTAPPDEAAIRALRSALNNALRLAPERTVVLTVDMQRGHLDPTVATLPVPAAKAASVVAATAGLLAAARAAGVPVVHVLSVRRRVEAAVPNPMHRTVGELGLSLVPGAALRPRDHNLEGSPQAELMPELGPVAGDHVVTSKKQLSAFYGTDLENLLRALGTQTVLVTGISTNTCVFATVTDAFSRGLATVVVSDCTASFYGEDLHLGALDAIGRSIGWVVDAAEVASKLSRVSVAASG